MDNRNERLLILLNLFAEDSATRAELDELLGYIADAENDQALHNYLLAAWANIETDKALPEPDWDQMLNRITHTPARKTLFRRLYPYAVAASVLLAIGIPLYIHQQKTADVAEQLAPVSNGVTLTAGHHKPVALNRYFRGQLTAIHGALIMQQDNSLSYTQEPGAEPIENTLTNNGSEKFSVTLADGTLATLDINSSLTYPVAFNKGPRKVTLTGQGYFKVRHNAEQPFFVNAKEQKTEDIGTEFNINAYEEPKTTLVEGSVRIEKLVLKPGEQAIMINGILTAVPVKLEDVTAWLQGDLVFHHEPLENILRDVARIYNVTFVWRDPELRKLTFGGAVTRTEKLATVLNYFRKAGGVDFQVEGRTIQVFKPKTK